MEIQDSSLVKQHFSARIFKSYFAYVRDHYPHIDVEKLCRKAGLEYRFLEDENNWVSCVFNLRLMKLLGAEIPDKEFSFKAGSHSVSKEGLGGALYSLGKNVFNIKYIYSNLWRLSSYLNKVSKFSLESSSPQSVTLKVAFAFSELEPEQADALRELIPSMIQNTAGYYSALPRLKGLRDSRVEVVPAGDDFLFKIQVPVERFRVIEMASVGIAVLACAAGVWESTSSTAWSVCSAISCAAVYGIVMGRRLIVSAHSTALHLEENFDIVNSQYSRLQLTQEELDRKYLEARALNAISNHLVKSMDEREILAGISKDLAEILSFDRVIIFICDDAGSGIEFRAGHVQTGSLKVFEGLRFPVHIDSRDPTKLSNVFRYRQSVLIKNVREHAATLSEEGRQALELSGSQSFIAVPIHSDEDSLGVILVDNVVSSRQMSEQDKNLLGTIARQVAVVVQKARAQQSLSVAYDHIEQLATSYSRFVPFRMIDLLGFKSVVDVDLKAGREYEMAVVFCDIRGFTTMSERMNPADSVAFLNSYFSSLAPIFEQNSGIIDKFLGDGIMALFLDPQDALRATIEFQRRLRIYNEMHRSGGRRGLVVSGVGVHFGKVLLGAVGYENRMSISVTSDSVNLASRIDAANKKFGVDMLCSEEFVKRLPQSESTMVRFVGRIQARGRNALTSVYEIIGHNTRDIFLQKKALEPDLRLCADLLDRGEYIALQELLQRMSIGAAEDPVVNYYRTELSRLTLPPRRSGEAA